MPFAANVAEILGVQRKEEFTTSSAKHGLDL